jgi:hypothetical protein
LYAKSQNNTKQKLDSCVKHLFKSKEGESVTEECYMQNMTQNYSYTVNEEEKYNLKRR